MRLDLKINLNNISIPRNTILKSKRGGVDLPKKKNLVINLQKQWRCYIPTVDC